MWKLPMPVTAPHTTTISDAQVFDGVYYFHTYYSYYYVEYSTI
eukprot:COSAG05_NODE_14777_length_387_cov_0.888889_1_plen_42_part_01